MEQHPVPRNISGFQFHLIGDMTLGQFGYLVAGGIIAYIIFRIAPFPKIINFPLAGFFGFIGIAFAFLPIQERPLDKWVVAFVKSIISPTQYTWRKANPAPDILAQTIVVRQKKTPSKDIQNNHQEAKKKLEAYLATLPKLPYERINIKEKKYIENTLAMFSGPTTTIKQSGLPPQPSAPPPSSYDIPRLQIQPVLQPIAHVPDVKQTPSKPAKPKLQEKKPIQSTINNQQLTISPTPSPSLQSITPSAPKKSAVSPLQQKSPPLATQHSQPAAPTSQAQSIAPVNDQKQGLQKQLSRLAAEKKLLEEELEKLQKNLAREKRKEAIKPVSTPEKEKKEPTIKAIAPKTAAAQIGMPSLPQYPNLVVGAIKDPDKKILPNIILTIKDKDGMPLRAIKTNKLGQFQTATPLPNGTYYLETEDPLKRYVFDMAEITLSGKICLPIEITAKGKKELMREKLTKQLFGNGK